MAERSGNILRAPHVSPIRDVGQDEILYSYAKFTQKGVTLESGNGVLEAGTLLARDAGTGKYVPVAAAAEATTAGILRQAVDTDEGTSEGVDKLGNIVISGIVKLAAIEDANVGVDVSAAVTALGGREDADRGFISF